MVHRMNQVCLNQINYYNISSYPFVAILDPRTGEKLMQFNSTKIDQLMFCEKVTTFLADYDMPIKDFELQNGKTSSNEVIKVDDEDDIVELNQVNNVKFKQRIFSIIAWKGILFFLLQKFYANNLKLK